VAGRARQLNHKIKSRKNAVISRREAEAHGPDDCARSSVLSRGGDTGHSRNSSNGDRASNSPTAGGFVAVNRHSGQGDRPQYNGTTQEQPRSNGPTTNGSTPHHGASAATRAELLSKFHTSYERPNSISEGYQHHRSNSISHPSALPAKPNSRAYADSMEYAGVLLNTASPVPIPNTPSSLMPYTKPSPADRFDDSGPFKADMMARMEQLNRGDRVQPPCDRCRRLHMDCLKNLTACMGCTKKHAKCSWKDVEEQELRDHPFVLRVKTAEEIAAAEAGSEGEGSRSGGSRSGRDSRKERRREMEVRDEELLGEESPDEDVEMKDRPAMNHLPRVDSSQYASTNIRSPSMIDTAPPPTHQENGASKSNAVDSGPENLPESPRAAYQAPQAQMQRFPTDEANGTTEMDGHVQTEYERDIYSQLNEATRASAEHEKSLTATELPEEPLRVYTAGSNPVEPDTSPVPPLELDAVQDAIADPPLQQQEQQQQQRQEQEQEQQEYQVQQAQPEETTLIPAEKEPSPPPVQERSHTPKPRQMPSPPLSGVPSQATPMPRSPVLEQQLAAQPMQI